MPTPVIHPVFDLNSVPEKDRERVARLIPNPALAGRYVHRNIEGVYDFDYLDKAIEKRRNVILAGPTGPGKTTLFRAYAAERGLPFYRVDSNASMDLATVLGFKTIAHVDGLAVDEWIDGNMTLIVRYGGVLLIDEINMVHPRVNAGYQQLLDVMRSLGIADTGEIIKAGKGGLAGPDGPAQPTLFASAYNPRYEGTVRLNQSLKNRFPYKIKWGYDRSVEEQLVKSTHLLDVAYGIRSMAEIRSPVATNMLQEFEENYYDFGIKPAMRLFINAFESEEEGPVERALEAESAHIARELEEARR